MTAATGSCVVLVPTGRVYDPGCEAALAELARRGHPVWRAKTGDLPPDARDRMTADALARGFGELLLIDPAVVFDPDDVGRLRSHGLPFVCGVYPKAGARALACEFPPDARLVRFGRRGGVTEVVAVGLGFALVRRDVFDAIRREHGPGAAYFTPADGDPGAVGAEDRGFCARARRAGVRLVADTAVRLWYTASYRYGWEDAGREPERFGDYTFHLAAADDPAAAPLTETGHPIPARSPLRGPAEPLPPGYPRLRAYVVTYPANRASLDETLASLAASDWDEEPEVVVQPADWAPGEPSAAANYKRALELAAADGCDFALILEDDVRVNRHLRQNLLTLPLVRRDQCDYLGLFIPDLIKDPWARTEPHLGYRLARPRYAGPDVTWVRDRVWGAQALLLSRRFVRAALDGWDRFPKGQDTRLIATAGTHDVALWYTAPCLAEHAPVRSAFDTPTAYAPDFDPDFWLGVRPGFEPPEEVPGWLTVPEAELLWRSAAGRTVLELGTCRGRSAVCLGQQARRVLCVDRDDQSEAAEWVRRYGLSDRVGFRRGDAAEVCGGLSGRFGLIHIDTLHDEPSVRRDVEAALRLLEPGGLLAFHDYPDPGWPDVRRVVDGYARRLGWARVAQADYLGVFRSPVGRAQ